MKLLLLTDSLCDFTDVLYSCGVDIDRMELREAVSADFSKYDAFCVLGTGHQLDARARIHLEEASDKGKHVFVQSIGSFHGIYSGDPWDDTHSRLIYVDPGDGTGIPGLETGDLLDDEANLRMQPHYLVDGYKPILVYKYKIIAHTHLNQSAEEILSDSVAGLWLQGDNTMMTSFRLHNFNKARFAPRAPWEKVIRYIARWITGAEPTYMPEPVVQYGTKEDLTDEATFEKCRKEAIDRGIEWLKQFLIDEGKGGILEGLGHKIGPDGEQVRLTYVRNDCSGEAAGAFRLYGHVYGDASARQIAKNLDSYTFGPMIVRGGPCDGFMRWSDVAWQVMYQDDAARCMLGSLYNCIFLGDDTEFPEICRVLDFLVKTTGKDGCRISRSDMFTLTEQHMEELAAMEHGRTSAHYNGYYLASLLLAYKYGKNEKYLEVGRRGLETLMALYPDTDREQSETQEMCRLILPLAALYDATREERHREMLYRVVKDLETHKHPSGGYYEWDTGYTATCNRESPTECSLLTENGDPVADLLYSVNWLPVGFAYAYYVTGDEWFRDLWKDIVRFCLKSQIISENPLSNGSWCRAFDMDLGEAYACPHDTGWAAYASETGWTIGEILTGMMFMDILPPSSP